MRAAITGTLVGLLVVLLAVGIDRRNISQTTSGIDVQAAAADPRAGAALAAPQSTAGPQDRGSDGSAIWTAAFESDVTAIAWGRDQSVVAAGTAGSFASAPGSGTGLHVFDRDGQRHWTHDVASTIREITVAPDGDEMLVAVYRANFRSELLAIGRHGEALWERSVRPSSVAYSADGAHLVLASGSLRWDVVGLYSVPPSEPLWSARVGGGGHTQVAVARDAAFVAAASSGLESQGDGGLRLFDRDGEVLWNYRGATDWTGRHFVAMAGDASQIATAHAGDSSVHVLDGTGNVLWVHDLDNSVRALSMSEDGRTLAVGTRAGDVVLLDHSGSIIEQWQEPSAVGAVALSVDGRLLAVGAGRDLSIHELR